jgi:hypothetical protein
MKFQDLPNRLRVKVLDVDTHQPIAGLALQCEAECLFDIQVLTPKKFIKRYQGSWRRNIGLLASDHVSYLAFDLSTLKDNENEARKKVRKSLESDSIVQMESFKITSLIISSPVDISIYKELLPCFDDFTDGLIEPTHFRQEVISFAIPSDVIGTLMIKSYLPSIQKPEIDDWRLSPASFGLVNVPVIGEDGCETLLPSHETTHIERFYQIQREPSVAPEELTWPINPADEFDVGPSLFFKRGKLIEYETTWKPLNHGLGQLLYSLTLAPCESVKVATIDWVRTDESIRR